MQDHTCLIIPTMRKEDKKGIRKDKLSPGTDTIMKKSLPVLCTMVAQFLSEIKKKLVQLKDVQIDFWAEKFKVSTLLFSNFFLFPGGYI